jgi:hypothetical protein
VAQDEREHAAATALDRLLDLIGAAVDLVPGAKTVGRGLAAIEHHLLRELRDRLARLESDAARGREAAPADGRRRDPESPAEMLGKLLERSIEQTPDEARTLAFASILRRLVPDEARIVGALSDGGGHPVVHVTAVSALGASSRRLLSNVTTVGQAAGVQLREMTPHYVAHLVDLGLAELGPEDPALGVKYEILESQTGVREAIAGLGRGEKRARARIVRRTLRLTRLGRDLWAACQPS